MTVNSEVSTLRGMTDRETSSRRRRRNNLRRRNGIFVMLAVVAVALVLNVPLIGAALTSLKSVADIPLGPFHVPFNITFDNYAEAFSGNYKLANSLFNSIAISLGSVVLVLLICYPAAFAIARMSFGGARYLQAVSSLRLLPAIFFVIPLYLVYVETGLLDTIQGMVIVNTFSQFTLALLILVSAFRDFPVEVEEAAVIDGAGLLRMLTTISAPIMAPALVAVSIVTFLFSWADYLFGLVLTTSNATPITVSTANFVTSYAVLWGPISAAAVVSVLPPIVLSIVLQRYLISGLTAGAVKG